VIRSKPALFHSLVRPGESRLFKKLKPPGPLPGERQFHTVYTDSMRCLSTSLRYGRGWPRCPHRAKKKDFNALRRI